jgi:GNAT superfamily N-acetyltransferase
VSRVRHHYRLALAGRAASEEQAPSGIVIRNPQARDADGLARLMLDAYRGTIDDEGETIDDALRFVQPALSHEPLLAASWLALDEQRPVSVLLVRRWKGRPLVHVVATHPDYARRQIATTLLERTLASLSSAGETVLDAWITQGNTASLALFTGRGFELIETWREGEA